MEPKTGRQPAKQPTAGPPPRTEKPFALEIQGMGSSRRWENVVAFLGEDMTDHIALRAGNERLMAVVGFGLARALHADGSSTYFAFPHALIYFTGDSLSINARHYVCTNDSRNLLSDFGSKLDDFEDISPDVRTRLNRLGEEMLGRLNA